METVVDALKAMKKATYREVAARLYIEPIETPKTLPEHREDGVSDSFDRAWLVGTAKNR